MSDKISYQKIICQVCGKEHKYDDIDLNNLEYIPIICDCGTKTKIYAETDVSGEVITP